MKNRAGLTLLGFFLATLCAQADVITFDTVPAGGTLSPVTAGTTVGWGYHLDVSLDPGHFFEVVGVSDSGFPGGFGTPSSGVFDYPQGSTSGVYEQDWAEGSTGLYEFAWDPGAFGDTASGTFTLEIQFWDGDPNAQGSTMLSDFTLDAPFFTSTLDAPTGPSDSVPEPASIVLFGSGLVGLVRRRLR